MVEFALVAPLLLIIIFGIIDFGRLLQINTTVADAARQGARQAIPNAASTPNPWGSTDSSPCSGTVFTSNAGGQGCLTDARIKETVASVLRVDTSTVNLNSNTTAANCAVPTQPYTVTLCISPAETGSGPPNGATASCTAAGTTPPSVGTIGDRKTEYTNRTYNGCFLVQVTVIYLYQPWTPLISNVIGNRVHVQSTTTMVAEY
jgi:hypothetical protein